MVYPITLAASWVVTRNQRSDYNPTRREKVETTHNVTQSASPIVYGKSAASKALKADLVILFVGLIVFAILSKRFEQGSLSAVAFRNTKIVAKIILGTMAITYLLYGIIFLNEIRCKEGRIVYMKDSDEDYLAGLEVDFGKAPSDLGKKSRYL